MVKIEKIKYLIIIALIFIAPSVYADTNISPKSGLYGVAGSDYYYPDIYTNYSSNASYGSSITIPDGKYEIGLIRYYTYFNSGVVTSANSYTYKYKICGGAQYGKTAPTIWEQVDGVNSDGWKAFKKNISIYSFMYNTSSEAITGASEGDPKKLVSEVQLVSGQPNCLYHIISFTPESSYRAVGFFVKYGTSTGYFDSDSNNKVTVTLVSLTQKEGVGGIVKNQTDKIIEEQQEIKEEIKGLPAKIWNIFKEGLKELFIPTEEQMQDLFDTVENDITTKLGILGLPINVYTTTMRLINNVNSEQNWCINWDNIKVPNFENHNIIQAGSWCFDTLEENQTMHTLRATSHGIMGALLLLSFLAYLNNKKNRILEIPDREDYTYITQEDVYSIDKDTGEVTGQWHKDRKTRREKN